MDHQKLKNRISKINPETLFADGFDDCLVGYCRVKGRCLAMYDSVLIIEKLSKDMTEEEAEEFFCFNIEGSFMGDNTPIFHEFTFERKDQF